MNTRQNWPTGRWKEGGLVASHVRMAPAEARTAQPSPAKVNEDAEGTHS